MNYQRRYDLGFVFILTLAFLFTLPWHQGFPLGDDYLGAALQLLKGNWDIEHNFWANRIGAYLPYAVGIKLFGFNTWLTFITTVEYLALLLVVYIALRKSDVAMAFVSVSILAVLNVLHKNAAIVMSDMTATLAINAVVLTYFLFRQRTLQSTSSEMKWGLMMALLFALAFWVKESVVFYLPLLLYYAISDWKKTRSRTFWSSFAAGSFFMLLAFLLAYWFRTGDALFRFHITEGLPNAADGTHFADTMSLLNRITWQPFEFLVDNLSFGMLFLLALLQVISGNSSKEFEKFFNVFFIITLATWWVGSQNFTYYQPVEFEHRLWLPLLVPMAINSAIFVVRLIKNEIGEERKRRVTIAAALFTLLSLVALHYSYQAYASFHVSRSFLVSNAISYIILTAALFAALFTEELFDIFPPVRKLFFFIVIGIPIMGAYTTLQSWFEKRNNHILNDYESEKEMVNEVLAQKPRLIISDARVAGLYFYYTLNADTKYPFIDYNKVEEDSLQEGDYLLLNPERQSLYASNTSMTFIYTTAQYRIPAFIKEPEKHGFVLLRENRTDRLYTFRGNGNPLSN